MRYIGLTGVMAYIKLCLLAVICSIALSARHSLAECGGRVRINDSEGWIAVPSDGDRYSNRLQCTWYIENNSSMPYVKLKFNAFSTECLWDYLHVFSGDSIYGEKVAALSGQIVVDADALMDEAVASGNGSEGSGEDNEPFAFETELVLNETRVVLFFFTDVGQTDTGFNVSYWTSGCVDNCTGNGQCEESTGECTCDPGMTGEYCQYPVCPNTCAGHGACSGTELMCECDLGFTGYDCSIPTVEPHWEPVSYASPLGPEVLGRTGHSAVVYGQHMWVYGGYRLRDGQVVTPGAPDMSSFLSVEPENPYDLIRYNFATQSWDAPELTDGSSRPSLRYGHTAVIFDDVMYVFGGALVPSEEVTNELWSLDLSSLTWKLIDVMESSGSGMEFLQNDTVLLPIAVRDHTAHIVGNKMVVFFGYSPDTSDVILNFVQEYDFVDGIWSAPTQFGDIPNAIMGHRSVYLPELNSFYVLGGRNIANGLSTLFAYDPVSGVWRYLSSSPAPLAYHSLVELGGVLVAFGGTSAECFQDEVLVYDIFCDSWMYVDAHGLYGNSSRFGHSAVVGPSGRMAVFGGFMGRTHHDLLMFDPGKCSRFTEREECLNASSGLCGWSISSNSCDSVQLVNGSDLILQCSENEPSSPADECVTRYSCLHCVSNSSDCVWNSENQRCLSSLKVDNATVLNELVNSTNSCLAEDVASCELYKSCSTCSSHSVCEWGDSNCLNHTKLNDNETTISAVCAEVENACAMTNSCSECTSIKNCLWCPSMNKCVNSGTYPYSFLYGQCLEWVDGGSFRCPAENCQEPGCSLCQGQPGCGWCRDPRDTGLGTCTQGGFTEPRNWTSCPDTHWFFDQCPLCNCNGHSQCFPESSTCIECQNNTKGTNCEECVDGLFGDPRYGNNCSVCDCNGYNDVCNNSNGNCQCPDAGVTGSRCTLCKTTESFGGDASNFCYYYMQVGFIYTFTVDPGDQQWFFATVPDGDNFINFRFEISFNPTDQDVIVQLFLARVSENFQILLNLTNPIRLTETNYYSSTFQSFNTYDNNSGLFSFLRGEQRNESFQVMFDRASANSYSTALWDGDLALIIYASNLTSRMQFKITIDQQDLIILLYFFTTFLTCFTLMLSGFFVGWYIKRRLEIRAYIRAQHIEMQRRVRRPFARLKAVVEKSVPLDAKQSASYVAVEMCRDGRAAILTVLVRFPWDAASGHPSVNRTGVCFGSTLVKMNSKPKDSKKKDNHHQQQQNGGGTDTSTST